MKHSVFKPLALRLGTLAGSARGSQILLTGTELRTLEAAGALLAGVAFDLVARKIFGD